MFTQSTPVYSVLSFPPVVAKGRFLKTCVSGLHFWGPTWNVQCRAGQGSASNILHNISEAFSGGSSRCVDC